MGKSRADLPLPSPRYAGPAPVERGPENAAPGPDHLVERCLQELVRYYRHSAAGRRLGGIVHRLNTPLQVLSFTLELLENQTRQGPPCRGRCPEAARLGPWRDYCLEKLTVFRREVENLQSQARSIIVQGAHEESQGRQYLDLNRLWRDELELYRSQPFFKSRVEKKFRFGAGLPPISGYYLDFSQSFRHLVDNALEAMAESNRRELTVETGLQDGCRFLRVGDTGMGIPAPMRERLFEPFFTTKGKEGAPRAGLGLFMVRRLLAPYGGRVEVESRPGETWATVRLPVA